MLQFWLIDSIVKARDSLNLSTPMIRPLDGTQEPLFDNDRRDSDSDDESPQASRRRRSPDLETGRGVSPLKLSPTDDITNAAPNNRNEDRDDKTAESTGTLPLPKKMEYQIKRRSPPPSPAPESTTDAEMRDEDWAEWEDHGWDQAANNPWGENSSKGKGEHSKRKPRSPKAASRSLSSSTTTTRTRMDVINTTTAGR